MESENRGPALASLAIVASAAALGWLALNSSDGERMADPRPFTEVLAREQDVVARLWEDPLQAVRSDIAQRAKGGAAERKGDDTTLDAFARSVSQRADAKICLLVVCLPDTPFPGDLEVRLRTRYAVQMALAQENRAPEFQDRLGYFAWNPERRRTRPEEESVLYMPYEWFGPSTETTAKDKSVSTLVLWMPESWLLHDPFGLLAGLRSKLVPQNEKLAGLFLIGPRSSNTLSRMIAALGGRDSAAKTSRWPALQGKFAIFSPQATAPDRFLVSPPPDGAQGARMKFSTDLATEFQDRSTTPPDGDKWTYFANFIAPDDQLTDALADELYKRDVGPALRVKEGPTNVSDVLVLAEADTSYGRSLPIALGGSLEKVANPDKGTRFVPPNVRIYRYLRGLDQQKGQQAAASEGDGSPPATTEAALAKLFARHSTMALGESQLDYVERLADQIERDVSMKQDEEAAKGTKPPKSAVPRMSQVKAVGVLGSDIYDKLILLRSLRPRFPQAVFFTTDLDARLWHPAHLPFTRNMVVATAYGVNPAEPHDSLAAPDIAPFRDAYQLAVFRACRAALQRAAEPKSDVPAELPGPRLYEIGRKGPVCLSPPSTLPNAEKCATPEPSMSPRQRGAAIALFAGLGIFLALWLVHDRIAYRAWGAVRLRRLFEPGGTWILCACVGALLLLPFWLYTIHLSQLPGGEPWTWTDGVSIWPTELLRFGIIAAVVSILAWSWQRFVRTRDRLALTYFPGVPPIASDERAGIWAALVAPWPHSQAATPAFKRVASTVFGTYLDKTRRGCRAVRVLTATVAYMALFVAALMLFGASGGNPHVRGDEARLVDRILVSISAIASLGLLFYVLDAVALCTRLLRSICGAVTIWPEPLVEVMRRRFNVPSSDVSGYLDVQFAAEISQELGRLVLFPFLVQLLFILSRNRLFDNWVWSPGLTALYVGNLLIACWAWSWLRRSARRIRDEALDRLQEGLDEATCPSSSGQEDPEEKIREHGLAILKRRIEGERRGAYARFFQDPALIAMVLPSGVVGSLMVIVRAFFDLS